MQSTIKVLLSITTGASKNYVYLKRIFLASRGKIQEHSPSLHSRFLINLPLEVLTSLVRIRSTEWTTFLSEL